VSFIRRFRVDLVVIPYTSFPEVDGNVDRCSIPPLSQRGLIARDPSRGDSISCVCLKSNPESAPEQLLDSDMRNRLAELGIELDVDSPRKVDGSDQRWHDFSRVDVAICARRDAQSSIFKPATKLLNAWAAGVIPLAAREPAYLEIGTDRRDVIFFDDIEEIPDILRELQSDPELRQRLRAGVAEAAAAQLGVDDLVDVWWEQLSRYRADTSRWRGVRSIMFALRKANVFSLAADGLRVIRKFVARN
jgi:glycosyltransferase involved in cell wall biosynthesis